LKPRYEEYGLNERVFFIIFLFVMLFMLVPGINHGLWRPDEPRVAGICAEMARTGDYIVPRLNGAPFLEYPPLYYVAGAVCGKILGPGSDIPYRLCSLFFSLLTLGIVFRLMVTRLGIKAGMLAAGILASSWGFFRVSRWIIVDIALVFGVTLSMYAYIRLITTSRARYAILFGLGLGLSFLTKGLVGPAIIAAAVLADMIRQKSIAILWRSRPILVLTCALIPSLPWVIGLYEQGGWPFMREVIIVNNFMRFAGTPEGAALGHQQGAIFYWDGMLRHMLPWTLLFIPAIIMSVRRYREDPFLSWIIGPLVLLSLSATKRGVYLVPLCPAAACMIATWLTTASRQKWEEWMLRITWGIAILACLAPFAGLGLGHPILGSFMGLIAFSMLVFFSIYRRVCAMHEVSLVLIICIALSASTSVYFTYKKPMEDHLAFVRKVIVNTHDHTLTIVGNDESTRGLFSLVAGGTLPVVAHPAAIKESGLYVWSDKNAQLLSALQTSGKVDILMKSLVDNREILMAFIKPNVN
jgi:hypothetical protein